MTETARNAPAQLLEEALLLKNAASQLLKDQLPSGGKFDKEDEDRYARIRLKHPDERSAEEILFLMAKTHEHAQHCDSFECELGRECWRMKGLLYHSRKLKRLNRLTPSAMVTLWNRHLELELHTASCANPIGCNCTRLDTYKYFLMYCKAELKPLQLQPVPYGKPNGDFNCIVELGPVLRFFRKHDTSQDNSSLVALFNDLLQKTDKRNGVDTEAFQAERRAEMSARMKALQENYDKETAGRPGRKMMGKLPDGKMVELEPKNGRYVPIGAPMHEDVARCGPSTSTGVPKKMMEEKKKEKKVEGAADAALSSTKPEYDPTKPCTSSSVGESKSGRTDKRPECDHAKEKKCHCTVAATVVDLKLGLKQKLVKYTPINRRIPRKALVEIKTRIQILAERFGPQEEKFERLCVRVITMYIDGDKYTVAFSFTAHNFLREDIYKDALTQYMFATMYYPDVCLIVFNFIDERNSDGEKRFKELMSECGVHVENLKYTRKPEKENVMKKIMKNWDELKKGPQDKETWFSGATVKLHGKSVEYCWMATLKEDRRRLQAYVDSHAIMELDQTKMPARVDAQTGQLQLTEHDRAFLAMYQEKAAKEFGRLMPTKEEEERVISKLKTKEAIDFLTTGKMPLNAKGEPEMPAELLQMAAHYNLPPMKKSANPVVLGRKGMEERERKKEEERRAIEANRRATAAAAIPSGSGRAVVESDLVGKLEARKAMGEDKHCATKFTIQLPKGQTLEQFKANAAANGIKDLQIREATEEESAVLEQKWDTKGDLKNLMALVPSSSNDDEKSEALMRLVKEEYIKHKNGVPESMHTMCVTMEGQVLAEVKTDIPSTSSAGETSARDQKALEDYIKKNARIPDEILHQMEGDVIRRLTKAESKMPSFDEEFAAVFKRFEQCSSSSK